MLNLTGTGRFTADPELRTTKDGVSVCDFVLAHNEYRKDANGERKSFAGFFNFVIWDKAAEIVCKYAKKGDLIEIRATPRQDKDRKSVV